MKFLIGLISLFAINCYATDGFFRYGVGLNRPADSSIASIKFFNLGAQGTLTSIFDWREEQGLFVDSNGDGRQNSFYISAAPGLSVQAGLVYIDDFWGISFITNPDSRLATFYEFKNDFELGLRDARGVGVGACYSHMSNAGLSDGNYGRDFISLKLSVPLN